MAGAWTLTDFDKPDRKLLTTFDRWGLLALAAFLGRLEHVAEEGPANDWLADRAVAITAAVTIAGTVVTFRRAFTRDEPLVGLSAFGNVNFAAGSVFSFVLGDRLLRPDLLLTRSAGARSGATTAS